jgi:hypothetical protein
MVELARRGFARASASVWELDRVVSKGTTSHQIPNSVNDTCLESNDMSQVVNIMLLVCQYKNLIW